MFCAHCGKALREGAEFCSSCGTRVTFGASAFGGLRPEPQREATPPQKPDPLATEQKPSPNRLKMILAIAVAVIIVVGGGLAAAMLLSQPAPLSSEAVTSRVDASGPSESKAFHLEPGWCRVELPGAWQATVDRVPESDSLVLKSADGKAKLAEWYLAGQRTGADEGKKDTYRLGTVETGSGPTEAYLSVYYLNDNGETAHWNDESASELGIARLFNATPDDLSGCTQLKDGDSWAYCALEPVGSDSVPAFGSTVDSPFSLELLASSGVPFWGIWIFGATDEGDARAYAQSVADQGFPARVELTTDWAGLNREPWYVVCIAAYQTQAEAEQALPSVHEEGFPDAYVKYTGNYQG